MFHRHTETASVDFGAGGYVRLPWFSIHSLVDSGEIVLKGFVPLCATASVSCDFGVYSRETVDVLPDSTKTLTLAFCWALFKQTLSNGAWL